MSNALNRDIKPGEEVVVKRDMFLPEWRALENRIFVCQSGFGMMSFTSGAKISGYYKIDPAKLSAGIRGEWIDAELTRKWQAGEPIIEAV